MSCALFINQGVRATYMFSPSVVLITLVIRRAFYEGITVKEYATFGYTPTCDEDRLTS